ncbi:MAG: hypothetical protein KDI27_14075 [Gammaproteobacteria bacterium]|nr:hypothetical protein [Gammaproteobacteria bacterium]MCP5415985.1 hypothetical protein [Chromatiaceae bacterium]
MDNHYMEKLRFQLMEEISNITVRVTALGIPRDTLERSLVARYGKLLFLSQQLLDTLPKLQLVADRQLLEDRCKNDIGAVIPEPKREAIRRLFGLV